MATKINEILHGVQTNEGTAKVVWLSHHTKADDLNPESLERIAEFLEDLAQELRDRAT